MGQAVPHAHDLICDQLKGRSKFCASIIHGAPVVSSNHPVCGRLRYAYCTSWRLAGISTLITSQPPILRRLTTCIVGWRGVCPSNVLLPWKRKPQRWLALAKLHRTGTGWVLLQDEPTSKSWHATSTADVNIHMYLSVRGWERFSSAPEMFNTSTGGNYICIILHLLHEDSVTLELYNLPERYDCCSMSILMLAGAALWPAARKATAAVH